MFGPSLYISDFNLGILYFLAVSSISSYGILIAGLKINPLIMKIIINKLSEFQKILLMSKFETKHIYTESDVYNPLFKTPSFTSSSKLLKTRYYSASCKKVERVVVKHTAEEGDYKLHSWFVTGFTDGEGCFGCSIVPRKDFKLGWEVKPRFQITLHKKDEAGLKGVKKSLVPTSPPLSGGGGGGEGDLPGFGALHHQIRERLRRSILWCLATPRWAWVDLIDMGLILFS